MAKTTPEMMARLRRERWHVSGYAGEHDEAGAHVNDAEGGHVLTTGHGPGYHSAPERWHAYFATAQLVASAPELLDALASLAAGEPGAQAKAELALARVQEWKA